MDYDCEDDFSGDDQYDSYYQQSGSILSEGMQTNLSYLRHAISTGDMPKMTQLYETNLTKLIDEYNNRLPPHDAPEMANIIGDDELFAIIYKELYYRQIYATGKPKLDDRFSSYYNYVNLFNYILTSEGPVSLELPNQWLWEIMDDFIYQFQKYSVFVSKFDKMPKEDFANCQQHLKMWNVHSVLNVLHSLVHKSHINEQLEVFYKGGNPDEVAGEYGSHSLYKMLGYFALIALLRLHSQLGDYYQAIKVLEHLELNSKGLVNVPACHVSTYYYVGFAYMMMRRYKDAISTFTDVLLYISRTKSTFQSRSYQITQIEKQGEKMLALLAICMVLHPQRIDESVSNTLKTHEDNMKKMQQGNMETFEQLFVYGCPRFLSPVNPFTFDTQSLDSKTIQMLGEQPQLQQWNAFKDEIEAQLHIPTIRSFLKLYMTMPVEKLAKFLQSPVAMTKDGKFYTEQELLKHYHRQLMSFKHLMSNVVGTGNGSLDGEFQTGPDIDFFIDKEMIHIADTRIASKYGELFIYQYNKFATMYDVTKKLQP